jgi:hypothetical protein
VKSGAKAVGRRQEINEYVGNRLDDEWLCTHVPLTRVYGLVLTVCDDAHNVAGQIGVTWLLVKGQTSRPGAGDLAEP